MVYDTNASFPLDEKQIDKRFQKVKHILVIESLIKTAKYESVTLLHFDMNAIHVVISTYFILTYLV